MQYGSEIHLLRDGDKVQVSYLLTNDLQRQMDLPASCYDGLRGRFIELCDGGDEIDYARCNANFPVRLRLELSLNGNVNGFRLIFVQQQATAKP